MRIISYEFEQKLRLILSIFYSKAKVGQHQQQLVPIVRRTKNNGTFSRRVLGNYCELNYEQFWLLDLAIGGQ